MGIDFNDAEGIDPALLEQAKKGEEMMKKTVATDGETLKISGGSGGGGGGGDLPFDQVLHQSQNDITKVKQILSMGGFKGPEKCKYETSLAHAEWVQARNLEKKCINEVKDKSVKYTALVNGKAQTHEINKAHKEWSDIREKCGKSSSALIEQANKYIETDRRCRANKAADDSIYPSITLDGAKAGFTNMVEGFFGNSNNSIKEGFDFYNDSGSNDTNTQVEAASGVIPPVLKYNKRLPRYTDTNKATTDAVTDKILPWNDYFIDCPIGVPANNTCINAQQATTDTAHVSIDNFNSSINALFDRADRLLNLYYNATLKKSYQQNALLAIETDAILENQKKNIALYKQNALYDYDEYNSLSFYEDLVMFLYYAVFAIFVIMSLRDFFSSAGESYDKRNIIILILLGIYPKYILTVVLWILNALTSMAELLGLKNVRFWGA
jgi:hypothetical protein